MQREALSTDQQQPLAAASLLPCSPRRRLSRASQCAKAAASPVAASATLRAKCALARAILLQPASATAAPQLRKRMLTAAIALRCLQLHGAVAGGCTHRPAWRRAAPARRPAAAPAAELSGARCSEQHRAVRLQLEGDRSPAQLQRQQEISQKSSVLLKALLLAAAAAAAIAGTAALAIEMLSVWSSVAAGLRLSACARSWLLLHWTRLRPALQGSHQHQLQWRPRPRAWQRTMTATMTMTATVRQQELELRGLLSQLHLAHVLAQLQLGRVQAQVQARLFGRKPWARSPTPLPAMTAALLSITTTMMMTMTMVLLALATFMVEVLLPVQRLLRLPGHHQAQAVR